jgi:hypothetical protein
MRLPKSTQRGPCRPDAGLILLRAALSGIGTVARSSRERRTTLRLTRIATFTRREADVKRYKGCITGTYDDLTAWTLGHLVVWSDVGLYVPNSNGHPEEDFHLDARTVIEMFELSRPAA